MAVSKTVQTTLVEAADGLVEQVTELRIKCPHCRKVIKLDEAMQEGMLERARSEIEMRLRVEAQAWARDKAKREVDAAQALAATARKQADDAALAVQDMNLKLTAAQKAQADAMARELKLQERERELDLEVQRKMRVEAGEIRTRAIEQARSEAALQAAEKDLQLDSMRKQIEELRQKAEQGSQQTQGEAQEMVLEEALKATWPQDSIEPVAKGVFGGDVLQRVLGSSGVCGAILWESKRTRTWSDGWLSKLRGDQRAARADVAVIVTQTLPPIMQADGRRCALINEVWVVEWPLALAIAGVVRKALYDVWVAGRQSEGQGTKAELVYAYLTGVQFRQRITGVMEYMTALAEQLDSERKVTQASWAKREKSIQMVVGQMAGLYGDMQGIIGGGTLPEISELPLLK